MAKKQHNLTDEELASIGWSTWLGTPAKSSEEDSIRKVVFTVLREARKAPKVSEKLKKHLKKVDQKKGRRALFGDKRS